jgi:O-antigen/teichoic acid export membrane protein
MAVEQKINSRLSLRRLMGWSVVGQLVYTISQFALLTVLARFASVEDVGRFGLGSAIIVPICFFFRLNMRTNQATDLVGEFRFSEFLRVQLLSISVGFILIVSFAIFLNDPVTKQILLIYGAAKCIETFSEFFYGRFQLSERLSIVGISLIFRGAVSTLLFSVVLIETGNIALSFSAHLLVWGAVALFFDFPQAQRLAQAVGDTDRCRPGKTYALARGALPLGVNGLLSGLQGQVPRFVIGAFLGVAALGQYTVVAYGIQAVTKFVMALGHALMTRLAQFAQQGNAQAVSRVIRKMLVLSGAGGAVMIVIALVFGDWLMLAVFGPSYQDLGLLLTFCMAIAAVRACVLILQAALFSLRKFSQAAYVRVIMLTILICAVVVGIQLGGLIGVTISVTIVTSLHAGVLFILLRHFLNQI